jgi:hypothetical protein
MTTTMLVLTWVLAFGLGCWVGQSGEARIWREKGDHEHMNRKESGGRLYQVKRESD